MGTHDEDDEVFTSAQSAEYDPEVVPGTNQAHLSTRMMPMDPEIDRHTRVVEVTLPPAVRRSQRQQMASEAPPDQDVDVLDDISLAAKHFYMRLHRFDRMTLACTLAAFVTTFLPWQFVVGDGWHSGIEGFGLISTGASVAVLISLAMRVARRRLSGMMLFFQTLFAAGIIAVPVYIALVHKVLETSTKWPWGMIGTALAGALVLLTTLLRLMVGR